MPKTRRRSLSWVKELISPPIRIDVASLEIPSEQHDPGPNIGDRNNFSGKRKSRISPKNEITAGDSGDSEEPNGEEVLESAEQIRAKHYLEHYFHFLHGVGLASFKEFWKKGLSIGFVIHKTLFWLLSILAILDAVKLVKLYFILSTSNDKGDMHRYIIIGRFVFNCAKRTYFVVIMSSGSNQILKIFDALDAFRGKYNAKVHALAFGIGLVSFAAAIIEVIFGWVKILGSGEDWSLTNCVLEQSLDMSLSIFTWTTNSTKFDEEFYILHKSYGEDLTPITVALGITGIVMGCVGTLLDTAVNDIMFFSAVTMYKLAKEFECKMRQGFSKIENVSKMYTKLQTVSECVEEAFGGLFKAAHAANLLTCANILATMVLDREYDIGVILLVVQMVKVLSTYYLSSKAASVNKGFRRWLRNKILVSDSMGYDEKLKASTILDESLESPVGLGTDTFFIDEIFLLKFATMVATFSLFLIDTKRNSRIGEN